MDKFVIIDGNNLIFRAFYALPQLANQDGEISNAVFGFTNMLVKVIKDINPKFIAVAFDKSKKNFRHDTYADYKGTRKPTPEELKAQFPILKDLLTKMNITVIEQDGLEADDLIGILSKKYAVKNIIVTADRDSFQLINDNTTVLFPKKGISETVEYDAAKLKEDYGVTPSQIIDLKALMGDASDNIPGVAGVGEKTALGLLDKYATLDGIYDNIDAITGKLKEKLVNDKEKAYMSYDLATIVTDAPLDYKIEDFTYSFPFSGEVRDFFKRYQFNSLLKKPELFDGMDACGVAADYKVDSENITSTSQLKKVLSTIKDDEKIGVLVFDNSINLCIKEKEYNIEFTYDLLNPGLDIQETIDVLKPVLEDDSIKKLVFDSKDLKHKLYKYGCKLNGVYFDMVIARYLVSAINKPNMTFMEMVNENLLSEKCVSYNLFKLFEVYYAKLEKYDLLSLYYDMEMPLVDVLFDMEITGFTIDENELDSLTKKYDAELEELTTKIYDAAGQEFNINSPKQLAVVLFDTLGLSAYNNKKRSTSIEILNELENQHPVVPLIIRYRHISKLHSTYLLAFKDMINPDTHKIYTIFNQTLTSTGRLSSSEPNLQNIPVKTEEGRSIRRMFVPSTKDGYIVSADYSQIELRLLANFCDDEKLISAYNSGEDIHTRTASEIFGIPYDMVTPAIRSRAKAINFGIVYGISDYGLSQNIGITRTDANNYIKLYFEKYPKIEKYMNSNVEFCKQNGYIKTIFGRIRFIPEISNSNYNLRSFGERASKNMPLQGSASDIIKLAMVNIFKVFNEKGLKSKLILQVHDELVVDTVKEELTIVKSILKEFMENVINTKVKLLVNIEDGPTWYEAK